MSILFGIRQAEGHAVEEPQLRRMASATDRYAPDGTFLRANGRVGMGFQPYHTHQRSHLEAQPLVNARGDVLTFDGRLDNSAELCNLLDLKHERAADSTIVLEAFSRWGETCFSRFVGDWALALWVHADRSLYLARDHAGTRTLFYDLREEDVLWATHLESLVNETDARNLDEAFAAAYLSAQPIRDLTPYKNIRAVSPAHYLIVRMGKVIRKPHWEWMARGKIRYDSEAAYDEHFFHLFRKAVERRTGPGAPIIAELSGGVDSSSIVCMSDDIRNAQGATPADLIDTVSYYDDSEPNWNETPYFTAVERARGKSGLHIEVSPQSATFEPPAAEYLWPGPEGRTHLAERRFEDQISARPYRVILSGVGGDELLGGPPDPLPELADYLVSLQFQALLSRGLKWGLAKRLPLIHLIHDAMVLAARLYMRQPRTPIVLPIWLSASLRKQATYLQALIPSVRRIGHLPSSIDSGLTWWSIMETLSRPSQRLLERREYRYPLLDRDLVDFLLRVPPNQLMRPGRRRLLMRRALRNIVPVDVLERRRKAFVMRGPTVALSENMPKLISLMSNSRLNGCEYIDKNSFQTVLASFNASSGAGVEHQLIRAIQLELWMRRSGITPIRAGFVS
jgi:asparagine synthase (glutamine-hydrolysing)